MKEFQTTEKLFWIDLEMTGLDVAREAVIEVAAIVTDLEFKTLDSFECVVKQPQNLLDSMDDWNKKHHGESGLLAKIPNGLHPAEAEAQLLALLDKNFADQKEKPILCGNSIGQDRAFLKKDFPKVEARLHYRMLDVSSWKIVFNNKYGRKYIKKNSHRALEDIQESIEELKFYLSHLQIK